MLRGFGQATPLGLATFFYATSTLAGALVPVPGGLGVTEASLLEQMQAIGHVAPAASTGAMILVRFATLWLAVLVGFVALGDPFCLGGTGLVGPDHSPGRSGDSAQEYQYH